MIPKLKFYAFVISQLAKALSPQKTEQRTQSRQYMAYHFLIGNADSVTFQRQDIKWSAFVGDNVTSALFIEGEHHTNILPIVLTWLENNYADWNQRPIVMNVGANIGAACIPLVLQTNKNLFAFEPVPDTFKLLQQNVAQNHLQGRISCLNLAIAATTKQLEMIVPYDSGQSEVKNHSQGFGVADRDCKIFSVKAISLDEFINQQDVAPTQVALVWSDTQGFESDVIESGSAIWQAGTPLWVEVWPLGLQAHGGMDRFIDCCTRSFTSMITATDFQTLGTKAKPRKITEMQDLVHYLFSSSAYHTDVLLIP